MRTKWNRLDLLLAVIGAIPAAAGFWMYDKLPDQMGTHFSISNEVNGTMPKLSALILFAVLGVGIPLILKAARKVDPKKESYDKFEKAFERLRISITLLFCIINLFLLAYNRGLEWNPRWITSVCLGVIFIVFGNYMGQIRPNYTIGVRTPWTLADEEVWRKTHRLTGPVWVCCGLGLMATGWLNGIAGTAAILVWLGVAIFVPIVYSYLIFHKRSR